jgi:hypothetical protein
MSVIDKKQEAIACIRMAVDNSLQAQLNADAPDDEEPCDDDQDIDSHWQHWKLGSLEGKKSNLRVMSAELGRTHGEYRDLDRWVRDFVACQMPEEAMQYEDDLYVCPSVDQRKLITYVISFFAGSAV